MPQLTLYTKPDCCLCDDAAAALERVRARIPFEVEAVDVTQSPDLAARYGERVPLGFLDGTPCFEYVVDEDALHERLAAAGAGAVS